MQSKISDFNFLKNLSDPKLPFVPFLGKRIVKNGILLVFGFLENTYLLKRFITKETGFLNLKSLSFSDRALLTASAMELQQKLEQLHMAVVSNFYFDGFFCSYFVKFPVIFDLTFNLVQLEAVNSKKYTEKTL